MMSSTYMKVKVLSDTFKVYQVII